MAQVYLRDKTAHSAHVTQNLKYNKKYFNKKTRERAVGEIVNAQIEIVNTQKLLK